MNQFSIFKVATFLVATLFITAAKSETKNVVIENIAFSPAEIQVHVGDKITWENKDIVPHTVTAKKIFDSKTILPGKTWSFKVTKASDTPYVCTFHPNMMGLIKVSKLTKP